MNRLEWTEHTKNELHERYLKLLEFVNEIANNKHYSRYSYEQMKIEADQGYLHAINIINAKDLLKEIGEE